MNLHPWHWHTLLHKPEELSVHCVCFYISWHFSHVLSLDADYFCWLLWMIYPVGYAVVFPILVFSMAMMLNKQRQWKTNSVCCHLLHFAACTWLSWACKHFFSIASGQHIRGDHDSYSVQPGAVKLVLWRHWTHVTQVHPVTAESQFRCTRLYANT